MNKAAQALGRMAKGVPKKLTKAEINRRKQRLAGARKLRWAKPCQSSQPPADSRLNAEAAGGAFGARIDL
jgi:hypothetical protein